MSLTRTILLRARPLSASSRPNLGVLHLFNGRPSSLVTSTRNSRSFSDTQGYETRARYSPERDWDSRPDGSERSMSSSSRDRLMLNCNREEYVDWVGRMTRSSIEKGWMAVSQIHQEQHNELPRGSAHDHSEALETAWKEFAKVWEQMEKAAAAKEFDEASGEDATPQAVS